MFGPDATDRPIGTRSGNNEPVLKSDLVTFPPIGNIGGHGNQT